MDYNLLTYLYNERLIDEPLHENLRNVIGNEVYYYGNQFRVPAESSNHRTAKDRRKALLRDLFAYYKYTFGKKKNAGKRILSNAYFNFNSELQKQGFDVVNPTWSFLADAPSLLGDFSLYRETVRMREDTFRSTVRKLTGKEYQRRLEAYKVSIRTAFEKDNIKALVVPNDVSFFENVAIEVFKEMQLPSFIFLHGLPARYNIIDENRTDYLIVWGDKIKEHYVRTGFDPSAIFVAGHPRYTAPPVKDLRSSTDNILVLAKIGVGSPHSTGMNLYDRGNQIVYLLMVQKALQQLGVRKVRLRFHPSANPTWHYRFIDPDFFECDNAPLPTSLQNASLVIGPSSTILLEALNFGVNYIVFEPLQDGKSLLNEQLVPPFNGTADGVPFADGIEALQRLIRNNITVRKEIFSEYIRTPFDISFLKEII